MKAKYFRITFLFVLFSSVCVAQISNNTNPVNTQQSPGKITDEERLEWWHEVRFGMFIHWGVYALYAGQYNGHEQARGGAEWILNRCKIPVAEYREKAKEFNPVNYDPDSWVKMAKDAGMKYLIITADRKSVV